MLSSLPWNALWPTNTLWQEPGCTSPSLGQCFLKGLGGPRLLQSHLELRQSGTTFWVKAINSHSLEDPLLSGLSKSFYQAKSSNRSTLTLKRTDAPCNMKHSTGLHSNPGGILCAKDSAGFWTLLPSWVSTETHFHTAELLSQLLVPPTLYKFSQYRYLSESHQGG